MQIARLLSGRHGSDVINTGVSGQSRRNEKHFDECLASLQLTERHETTAAGDGADAAASLQTPACSA
jgi:hypothetical protein